MSRSGSGSGAYSCYLCWAGKHKCDLSASSDKCSRCISRCLRANIGRQATIACAPDFPYQEIQEQLRNEGWSELQCSLDTHAPDTSVLHLDFRCSLLSTQANTAHCSLNSNVVAASIIVHGAFTHHNQGLVSQFDQVVLRYFSVELEAKEAGSHLIYYAVLAGGYLRLLGSTVAITPQIRISLDGMPIENQNSGYRLDLHLRRFLVFRLGDLVDPIMKSIRTDPSSATSSMPISAAIASAAILQFEVEHARKDVKTGAFSEHVIDESKMPLAATLTPDVDSAPEQPISKGPTLDWLAKINSELKDRLAEDCNRNTYWRSVLEGSLKQLRRPSETISIFAHLSQTKFSPEHPKEHLAPLRSLHCSRGSLASMRRSTPRRLSGRVLSKKTTSASQSPALPRPPPPHPSSSLTTEPPSFTMNSCALSQINGLSNYPINAQVAPRSLGASSQYTPCTVSEGLWVGFNTNHQLSPNALSTFGTSGTLQSPANPSPLFNFHGQQDSQSNVLSGSQVISDSSQGPGNACGVDFTDSTFSFVNFEDHENAIGEAYMDPNFIF